MKKTPKQLNSPNTYRSKLRNYETRSSINRIDNNSDSGSDENSASFNYKSPIRCRSLRENQERISNNSVSAITSINNNRQIKHRINPMDLNPAIITRSGRSDSGQNSSSSSSECSNSKAQVQPQLQNQPQSTSKDASNCLLNLATENFSSPPRPPKLKLISKTPPFSRRLSCQNSFKSSNLNELNVLKTPSAFSRTPSSQVKVNQSRDSRHLVSNSTPQYSNNNHRSFNHFNNNININNNNCTNSKPSKSSFDSFSSSSFLDNSNDTCELLDLSIDNSLQFGDLSNFDSPMKLQENKLNRKDFTPIMINYQSPLKIRRENFIKRKHHTPLRNCAKIAKRFEDQATCNYTRRPIKLSQTKNSFEPINRIRSRKRTFNETSTTPLKLEFKKLKI